MQNPLKDIHHYSPTMNISQLLKFCEKKGLGITRAMIQNYIRDGLLPPPVDKRKYTHKHLAAIVIIELLKTVFDMPAIKDVLTPYMDEEGLPVEEYNRIITELGVIMDTWHKSVGAYLDKINAPILVMAHIACLRECIDA